MATIEHLKKVHGMDNCGLVSYSLRCFTTYTHLLSYTVCGLGLHVSRFEQGATFFAEYVKTNISSSFTFLVKTAHTSSKRMKVVVS